MDALADSTKQKLANKPQIIIEQGLASAAIVHTAIKNDCDLIVMGVHGASGFREQFIGTNTYNVVKYAECPVLNSTCFNHEKIGLKSLIISL